jgi:ABC-type Zn uptake system ZnuABC Zn-binding protein ZnuA
VLRRLPFLSLLILSLVAGCGPAKPTAQAQGLRILASTTILADFTRNVVGDRAKVDSLYPAGADPHGYQVTPADAVKVSESNLLILNGAGYERSLQSALNNADNKEPTIIASQGLFPADEAGKTNPHFWVNPKYAVKYVENIRDGLIKADPTNAKAYTANAEAYIAQLNELDSWAEQQISALPPERRLLVTNHDALGYLAQRYGLQIAGVIIPSASADAGASAQQLASVINTIRANHAPAIFVEKVENPALAEQVASETGAVVVSDLYFESLSEAGGPAPTYLDMMRHDINRIVEALKR